MMTWHTCNVYCDREVHAIPLLTPLPWHQETVLQALRTAHARTHPDELVVAVIPAYEADVATWKAITGWHDGLGNPTQPAGPVQPWLAFLWTTSVPPAPSRFSEARRTRYGEHP